WGYRLALPGGILAVGTKQSLWETFVTASSAERGLPVDGFSLPPILHLGEDSKVCPAPRSRGLLSPSEPKLRFKSTGAVRWHLLPNIRAEPPRSPAPAAVSAAISHSGLPRKNISSSEQPCPQRRCRT